MRKQKAARKMTNVVHSGWMTKSPPEKKMRKKIFRSHWKKRYFVLEKPIGSHQDQYELHYYKDQRCHNKKGSIDLEQCEQIIEALDSENFPNLFAIKTAYKNKLRTYYLATDTEKDMNQWVHWLIQVCGLRPEDQPTDLPEPKPSATAQKYGSGLDPLVINGTSSPSPQLPVRSPIGSPSPVFYRENKIVKSSLSIGSLDLVTGSYTNSSEAEPSMEKVQHSEAPPLPQKRQGGHKNGILSSDNVRSVYDHPPNLQLIQNDSSGLYLIPPPVGSTQGSSENERNSGFNDHNPRTLSAVGVMGQAAASKEPYDYPIQHYDSSDGEIPPARPPPKLTHLQSPYLNVPSSEITNSQIDIMSMVPAPAPHLPNQSNRITGYDTPPSSSSSSYRPGLSQVISAPQSPITSDLLSHTYLNSKISNISDDIQSLKFDGQSVDYSEADVPPHIPLPRTGFTGDSGERSISTSIYQHPPLSSASPPPPSRGPAHSGVQKASKSPNANTCLPSHNPENSQAEGGTTGIFSTKRTRSFKSPHSMRSKYQQQSVKTNPISLSATVPAPKPAMPPRPKEMSTSSEDELTYHPMGLLRSIPAPSPEPDRPLKYLDLAPPDLSPEPSRSPHTHGHHTHSHSHTHSHGDRGKESVTEYREIDFVKTQALSDTKRVKENERKHEDHT